MKILSFCGAMHDIVSYGNDLFRSLILLAGSSPHAMLTTVYSTDASTCRVEQVPWWTRPPMLPSLKGPYTRGFFLARHQTWTRIRAMVYSVTAIAIPHHARRFNISAV